MKNKSLIAIICFAIAGLLVMKFFNFSLGSFISWLLPFILIICGIIGYLNGKKVIGSIMLAIGGIFCLSYLGRWVFLILAAALVYIGLNAYKNKRKYYY